MPLFAVALWVPNVYILLGPMFLGILFSWAWHWMLQKPPFLKPPFLGSWQTLVLKALPREEGTWCTLRKWTQLSVRDACGSWQERRLHITIAVFPLPVHKCSGNGLWCGLIWRWECWLWRIQWLISDMIMMMATTMSIIIGAWHWWT